jgi:hypothetical protein
MLLPIVSEIRCLINETRLKKWLKTEEIQPRDVGAA